MNLPSFPTDNLYKFLAIAGLALTLFCTAYPLLRLDELHMQVAILRGDLKAQMEEEKFLTREVELIPRAAFRPVKKG